MSEAIKATHSGVDVALENIRLRDEFAKAVLGGYVVDGSNFVPHLVAELCYELADEMLKARLA